jgi:DNA-binding response OmpR family regulator
MRKLLLIDDDHAMAPLLGSLLSQHGFEVVWTKAPAEAASRLGDETAAILVGLDLPGEEGFALVKRLREEGERRPILALSTRSGDQDCIRALKTGADDYLAKPFNYLVLVARLESSLRRSAWCTPSAPTGDGLVKDQRALRLRGRVIPLTVTEYHLLEVMTAHAGKTFPRGDLWELIDAEGTLDSFDRAIDLHMSRLRAKLEANPKEPRHLLTVRGVGYRFEW